MTHKAAIRFGQHAHSPPDGFFKYCQLDARILYPRQMDYASFKALQAVLFFGVPIIWGVWQLYVLNRSDDEKRPSNGA